MQQGDNLVPTLFIIVMQLVAEDMLGQLKSAKIDIPQIKCSKNRNRVLKLCKVEESASMELREINIFTHADDRVMLFNIREDVVKDYKIVCKAIAK